MPKHRTVEEVHDECIADNLIKDILEAEPQKARDLLENGDIYLEGAVERAKRLSRLDRKWMLVLGLVRNSQSVHFLAGSRRGSRRRD